MKQAQSVIRVPTRRGLTEVTDEVLQAVTAAGVREGLCTVFIRHTSASLVIQENADPAVRSDLERFLSRLVPDGDALYEHVAEGPDDMPSHVKSASRARRVDPGARAPWAGHVAGVRRGHRTAVKRELLASVGE